ncbi:MAG TPA: Re/Si-specific NAD(P)(+) transhydrogenase subunit alpha [Flavobacteriaceae bacterium]|nr:Re/Si-specific NAD(P)(+) transhydrogenase subunit alpha [Flavobacteriaceae bacterium]
MVIGLLKERAGEKRVAFLPEIVAALIKKKVTVLVEKDAGETAFITDLQYSEAGAKIVERQTIFSDSNLILQIQAPHRSDLEMLNAKQVWVSAFNPLVNNELVREIRSKGITSFSLDMIPRTSRAQAMDVLSSMATVSGYRAVLDAAYRLPVFFPMFMSAAGTIRPANVLILGAGVAGLQAISAARKLGAQVEVFDVRSAVKEEVMSLGAKFVEVEGAKDDKAAGGYAVEQDEDFKKRQQEAINLKASKADVVICTAQIPGRKAPLLLPKAALDSMKPGSVIIDLAASSGGNCDLTEDGRIVEYNKVSIVGKSNYVSEMPVDASRMFGKNAFNFISLLISEEGEMQLNFEDELVLGTCITHEGELYNERVKSLLENKTTI